MNKLLAGISILMILAVSCNSGKKLNKTVYKAQTSNDINAQLPDYKWFQAKGKISISNKDNSQQASLLLFIRHDSLIWGTVNAVMGLEIFRFIISRDSLLIIDRTSKKYYKMPLKDVMLQYAWKDAGFDDIEKLIFGYCIFKTDEHYLKYKDENTGEPYLHYQDMILDRKIYSGKNDMRINGYTLTRIDNSQRVNIRYKDKISYQDFSMPAIVDLKFFTAQEFSLNLTFSSIRFMQQLNLNTSIPQGYEKGN